MNEFAGSTKEVARNANRVEREKEIIAERKEEHMSKELGVRARSYYEDPDYDQLDVGSVNRSVLKAPSYPGYEQRWMHMHKENGSHLLRMLNVEGWKIRDPKTVPLTAGLTTSKWGEYEAIVAGNELILCCMRKDFYEKKRMKQFEEQERRTRDIASLGRDLYGATATVRKDHAHVYSPEFSERQQQF